MSGTALALRPYQREAIEAVHAARSRGIVRPAVVLPTGCHRAGQHVLMHDGTTRAVEDVQVGDLLMGPDGTPRTVLALARGTGPMLEIRPDKGTPWVVNDQHVLTLTGPGGIVDVPLPVWATWPADQQRSHALFRSAPHASTGTGVVVEWMRTGFTVEPTRTVEPFYGFTLDGDQRYLLDDFTVTHNSGKTVTFGHLAAANPGRTLVLAHREELIKQAHVKLTAIAPGLRPGIEMASRTAGDAQAVVGSVQSMSSKRRLAAWPRDSFSLIICDEAHHAAARTYVDVMEHFGCYAETGGPLTVGFTATLARGDGVGLGGVWQEVAYEKSLLEMIVEGYLVNPSAITVPLDFDISRAKVQGGDYTEGSLGGLLTEAGFEQAVVHAWKEHAQGKATLVFTPTVATAQAAAAALREAGAKAEAVWGAMDRADREKAVAGLGDGTLDVLTNCNILTEGTDIPRAEVAILARPTRSRVLFTQMIGRILRPHADKTGALVIDLVSATADNKLCTLVDLAAGDLPEGKPKPEPKEGETLTEAVERARGVRLGTAQAVNLFGSSKSVWLQTHAGYWFVPAGGGQIFLREVPGDRGWNIGWMPREGAPTPLAGAPDLELAMALGEEKAERAERAANRTFVAGKRDARWRSRRPSEKAIESAGRWGVAVPPEATAGEVSDLISVEIASARIDRYFGARNRGAA